MAEPEPPADPADRFPALVVREACATGGVPTVGVEWLQPTDLPPGEVTLRVDWSSINYKDVLACEGNRGIVGGLPHVPGIDAAGVVVASDSPAHTVGDRAFITGYGLGSPRWGGHACLVRADADWLVPLPDGLTDRQAMVYGTAGFTAAQAVMAIQRAGVIPGDGPLLVTGATGGVGVFAVALLAKLGYEVVAMTGKSDRADALVRLGASRIVDREALADESDRPLLSEAWAGGVDSVGGATLSALIRSTRHRGCVASCGLVGGAELPLTVYPFLLRGVTLAGIDSAKCPREPRLEVWRRLAGPWRIDLPDEFVTEVTLDGVPNRIDQMRAGTAAGRTVVRATAPGSPTE